MSGYISKEESPHCPPFQPSLSLAAAGKEDSKTKHRAYEETQPEGEERVPQGEALSQAREGGANLEAVRRIPT